MKIYNLLKVEGEMKELKTSFSHEGIMQIIEHTAMTDTSEDCVYYLYGTILDTKKPTNITNLLITSGTIKEVIQFLKKNLR